MEDLEVSPMDQLSEYCSEKGLSPPVYKLITRKCGVSEEIYSYTITLSDGYTYTCQKESTTKLIATLLAARSCVEQLLKKEEEEYKANPVNQLNEYCHRKALPPPVYELITHASGMYSYRVSLSSTYQYTSTWQSTDREGAMKLAASSYLKVLLKMDQKDKDIKKIILNQAPNELEMYCQKLFKDLPSGNIKPIYTCQTRHTAKDGVIYAYNIQLPDGAVYSSFKGFKDKEDAIKYSSLEFLKILKNKDLQKESEKVRPKLGRIRFTIFIDEYTNPEIALGTIQFRDIDAYIATKDKSLYPDIQKTGRLLEYNLDVDTTTFLTVLQPCLDNPNYRGDQFYQKIVVFTSNEELKYQIEKLERQVNSFYSAKDLFDKLEIIPSEDIFKYLANYD